VATWEDVWEELPTDYKPRSAPREMNPPNRNPHLYFRTRQVASRDQDPKVLKADESTHIDQLVELLENEMSSSEIFAALFELELNGKIRQLPGKNFVKSFSCQFIKLSVFS